MLVTGATGMVGSWLVKELLAAGAYVVALVLDLDPQSELVRSGDLQRCAVVNGALEDSATLERAVTLHEVDTVFHLGAQTIVGVAQRAPLATLEANVRGTYNLLEACRRHADLVQRVVVASSDKAYGETERCPTPRTRRSPDGIPTRSRRRRRPDRAVLPPHLRPAGRRSPAAATSTAAAT